jgi:hypothetical protein
MKRLMTCKQAAALMVARQDRPLGLWEGTTLRMHLLACKACPNFARQLDAVRDAMQTWRNYRGD